MKNLSLQIKCSFSKINSTFFFPALFYPTLISTLFKAALKNFKRMLLERRFDGFFRFLNLFFKAPLLNWFKNLRAQIGLYQKRAGVLTSWTLNPPPLVARLLCFIFSKGRLMLFFPIFPFDLPEKHQKTFGFLMFSGGSKWNIEKKRVNLESDSPLTIIHIHIYKPSTMHITLL